MASINLNGKRRRVEQAASGLSKPFKSPLRRQPQTTSPTPPVKPEDDATDHKTNPPSSIEEPETSDTPSTPASSTPQTSRPPRNRKPPPNYLLQTKKPLFLSDPEILDLQKQQRALQSRLATLRSELDTAQQALRLESSPKDRELEALIAKWRSVSQNAAEEVFAGAQERVARMGGLKAWKERVRNDTARWEREEMEAWYGDEEAEAFRGTGEEELESRRAEMMDRVDIARKKGSGEKEREVEEDEEFTMEVMLKTLNIEMKAIGYDQKGQKWEGE